MASELHNPAQRAVLVALGRGVDPVVFPSDLGSVLQAELEAGLVQVAPHLDPGRPLWVGKHALSTVHGCEAHHIGLAGEPFTWTIASVRGTVAHKAIELGVNWRGGASPAALVDEALDRLAADERGPGGFLAALTPADRAQLRGAAVDLVAQFQECFPPLRPAWVPVTESRARVELCSGAVVLSGRTDLTLGRAKGLVAGKVIIDFKSGPPVSSHTDDLRFYALLETLKLGVPPRRVASYYLDAGRTHAENVTIPLLRAAARRLVDGVIKIVELTRAGRPPTRLAGPACRWCPFLATCGEGQRALDEAA